MLLSILTHIKNNFPLFSLITFVVLYASYFSITRMNLYLYKQKYSNEPIHYRTFRLYGKNLISNAPSKKEKKFYQKTNKITLLFNILFITAFAFYLIVTFI